MRRDTDVFTLGRNVKAVEEKNTATDFDTIVKKITHGTDPTIRQAQQEVREQSKKAINQLRLTGDNLKNYINNHVKPVKENVPYFIPGGYCEYGHSEADLEYNGHIQFDIDFKFSAGNIAAEKVFEVLKQDPHFEILDISFSGFGVKGIVQTDNFNKEFYIDTVSQFYSYIVDQYGDQISEILSLKNPKEFLNYCDNLSCVSPCFLWYGPKAHVNRQAVTFHVDVNEEEYNFSVFEHGALDSKTVQGIAEAIEQLEWQDGAWEEWYQVGYALYHILGEEGYPLFDHLSRKSNKYQQKKTLQTWKSIRKANPERKRKAGFTTLRNFLLPWGIDLPYPERKRPDKFLPLELGIDPYMCFHDYLTENDKISKELIQKLFKDFKKPCIVAPPESAKTTLIFKELIPYVQETFPGKIVVYAAPMRVIAEQNGLNASEDIGVQIICEGYNTANTASVYKHTTTTFKSLPDFIERIKNEFDLQDVVLILDELHELILSTYQKLSAFSWISNNVFKCIGLTGTYLKPLNYYGFEPVICHRNNNPKLNFRVVFTEDAESELHRFATDHSKEKNFYLYNSQKGVGRLATTIKKKTGDADFYHADLPQKKTHRTYNTLVTTGSLPEDINHFFVTKALALGANFKGDNFVYVCEPGKRDFVELLQGYNRLRGKAKNVYVILKMPKSGEEKGGCFFDFDRKAFDKEKARLEKQYILPFNDSLILKQQYVSSLKKIEGYQIHEDPIPDVIGDIDPDDKEKVKLNTFTGQYICYDNKIWAKQYDKICASVTCQDFINYLHTLPNATIEIVDKRNAGQYEFEYALTKAEEKAIEEADLDYIQTLVEDPEKRKAVFEYVYINTERTWIEKTLEKQVDFIAEQAGMITSKSHYYPVTCLKELLNERKPPDRRSCRRDTENVLKRFDQYFSELKTNERFNKERECEKIGKRLLNTNSIVKFSKKHNKDQIRDAYRYYSWLQLVEQEALKKLKDETHRNLFARNFKKLENFTIRFLKIHKDFYATMPDEVNVPMALEESYWNGKNKKRIYRLTRLGVYRRFKETTWYKEDSEKAHVDAGKKKEETSFDIAVIKSVLKHVVPDKPIDYIIILSEVEKVWGSLETPAGLPLDRSNLKEYLQPFFEVKSKAVKENGKTVRKLVFQPIEGERIFYQLTDFIPEKNAKAYFNTLKTKIEGYNLKHSNSIKDYTSKVVTAEEGSSGGGVIISHGYNLAISNSYKDYTSKVVTRYASNDQDPNDIWKDFNPTAPVEPVPF